MKGYTNSIRSYSPVQQTFIIRLKTYNSIVCVKWRWMNCTYTSMWSGVFSGSMYIPAYANRFVPFSVSNFIGGWVIFTGAQIKSNLYSAGGRNFGVRINRIAMHIIWRRMEQIRISSSFPLECASVLRVVFINVGEKITIFFPSSSQLSYYFTYRIYSCYEFHSHSHVCP